MHIAVDGSGLNRPHAGVGVYTTEIIRAMAVCRPRNRMTVHLGAGVESPWRVPSIAIRRQPATPLLGRHWRWPARLRRSGADAYFGPAGLLPLGDTGLPAIITAHDVAIYRNRDWFPSRQPLATKLVVPRTYEHADAIIAVSQQTASDIREIFHVEDDRLHVVHEGVSLRFRRMHSDEVAAARQKWGLPERFVLFLGTIEPRKNLDTLLDAWVTLERRPPLVIAGGWGWRYEKTKEKIERLGEAVILLGGVSPEDLPALYNLATVLCHPAWYEGFGLTVLEAMACGTPVISSNSSSLPEVVGDAGVTIPPGDPERWREAMAHVLGDPVYASDLRRAGLLRAAQFSWERAAERTWRVIEAFGSDG